MADITNATDETFEDLVLHRDRAVVVSKIPGGLR